MMVENAIKYSAITTADFTGIFARPEEINRLKMELNNSQSLSEGVVADEWQQYFKVTLTRYDPNLHKVLVMGKSADFVMIEPHKVPKTWTTLDFMLTVEPDAVTGLNAYLMDSRPRKQSLAWRGLHQQVLDHLAKADIVPLDFRNLYPQNRTKLLQILLSLSYQQQQKIVLIVQGD